MSKTCPDLQQRGFSTVAAIAIILVLGALAGFVVSVSSTQSLSFALDLQSARSLQAANAGVEWGIHQITSNGTDLNNCKASCNLTNCGDVCTPPTTIPSSSPPYCANASAVLSSLAPVEVSVSCVCRPYCEGSNNKNNPIRIYTITSRATTEGSSPGSAGHSDREIQAVIEEQ